MCSNITLGSANDKEQECAQHSTVNDANNECVHNERGQYIQITEGRLNCSLRECETTTCCCAIRYSLIGSRLKGMAGDRSCLVGGGVLVVVGKVVGNGLV